MDVQLGALAAASAEEKMRVPKGWMARGRPVPADFVEATKTMGQTRLKAHYHANPKTIARWLDESGATLIYVRPATSEPPADFADVAATMTKTALERHYRRSYDTIARWMKMTGAKSAAPAISGQAVGRPVPDDFAEMVRTLTQIELERHYGVYRMTMQRWLTQTGFPPRKYKRGHGIHGPQPLRVPTGDAGVAAQAAQFLRSAGLRQIVYPCDILTREERAKLPNMGKGLWYLNGRGAVEAETLIEIAEAKGFDRRAWARI